MGGMTTKELRLCCVRELPELPEPHEPPPTLPLQLPSFSVQLYINYVTHQADTQTDNVINHLLLLDRV
jgi:hypothetical protein